MICVNTAAECFATVAGWRPRDAVTTPVDDRRDFPFANQQRSGKR